MFTAKSVITGKLLRLILYELFEIPAEPMLRGEAIYLVRCRDCWQTFEVPRPEADETIPAAPLLPLLAHRATHAPTSPPPAPDGT